MKNEKMMREAPVWKLLFTMGLPTIVVMIVQVLYNMADVFFIGQGGNAMQVAALSLSGPAFNIFQGVGTLFGAGGCTAIAIALGQGDREKAKYYSSFCAWASVITGVALAIAMFLFMDPLLSLMGANEETAGFARTYLSIILLGVPFTMFGGGLGNAIRADGSSAKTMLIALAGTFTNILLDPLFISVFQMGIAGAAWATVIGNVVTSVLVFLHVKKSDGFTISPKYLTLKKDVSLRVVSLGVPMAGGTVLMCVSSMFSNQLLVKYGNIAVAANGVASKAGMLVGMIVMGVCMGMQPVISYTYGTGDRGRMRRIILETGVATTILSTVLGGVFLLGRETFVTAFLDDPQILETGKFMMLTLLGAPVGGIYQLCSAYLQGTGKVSYATVTSLLSKGIVYVPVLFAMEALAGLPGLVFAGVVTDVISTAAGVILCLVWARQSLEKPLAPVAAEA
ncbi:MATE family efflux transporter [Acutalibacter sp. 1XD8-33]|uniref:MATE family efflux transporter n=1 Tax=Acutalibacter sp. 1XD8-33 TaxID=2320081 RepID=UPI000EA38F37|nr:MATE family efflux transporter [Acutalibacter sp. 1XD8-33]RKJ39316.1 MATE family efflux transporter [Acutalibacter sp. 1XD8-33]